MDGPKYTKICEGFTPIAKPDTGDKFEVGYGFDYVNGAPVKNGDTMTRDHADAYFPTPYASAQAGAAIIIGSVWPPLDDVRKAAICDMCYELGYAGLSGFRHMILAVQEQQWEAAHDAVLSSIYATQVPDRAQRTASMLLTGNWPVNFGG